MECLAAVRGALTGEQREGAAQPAGHHAQGAGWQLADMAQICDMAADETSGGQSPLPMLHSFFVYALVQAINVGICTQEYKHYVTALCMCHAMIAAVH